MDIHLWGTFIHHSGMVCTNELAFKAFPCGTIDGVAINFSVAIDHSILTREVFTFRMDMKGVGQRFDSTEFTTKVFFINIETKLVGVVSIVHDSIVDVVI